MRLFGRTWGHDRQREQLSVSLDGKLSAPDQAALERHLASCDACRTELDGLRATVALLRAAPAPQPRRSFALTPAMLETAPAKPWLTPPARLPATTLAGARWATAAAGLLLFAVVSYDAGQNVLVYANSGNLNRQAGGAATAAFAPASEAQQALRAAPAAERAAGAPGSAPSQAQAPVAPAAAPATTAQESAPPAPPPAPTLKSAPPPAADSAGAAANGAVAPDGERPAGGARTEAAPDGATAPVTPQGFGAIHPVPQPANAAGEAVPPLRWLQAALLVILSGAGFTWWWGRRPA